MRVCKRFNGSANVVEVTSVGCPTLTDDVERWFSKLDGMVAGVRERRYHHHRQER
jgi:hypothetical protein